MDLRFRAVVPVAVAQYGRSHTAVGIRNERQGNSGEIPVVRDASDHLEVVGSICSIRDVRDLDVVSLGIFFGLGLHPGGEIDGIGPREDLREFLGNEFGAIGEVAEILRVADEEGPVSGFVGPRAAVLPVGHGVPPRYVDPAEESLGKTRDQVEPTGVEREVLEELLHGRRRSGLRRLLLPRDRFVLRKRHGRGIVSHGGVFRLSANSSAKGL